MIKYNPPDKIITYIINQINTIYNRFNKTNEFAWIIKLHKGVYLYDDTINNLGETTDDTLLIKKEYKKGETYKNLFTKILPRFIFPKKVRKILLMNLEENILCYHTQTTKLQLICIY